MHSLSRNLYRTYCGHTNITSISKLKNIQLHSRILSLNKNFCTDESAHDKILKQVSQGDEEIVYRLKVLEMEMELLRQEGQLVPETNEMKAKHYEELLSLKHRNKRISYLEYLFKLSKKKENQLRKKAEKALKYEEYKKTKVERKDISLEEFIQSYDLSHNNLFLRIRDKTINNFYNGKMINAMQFGQKLIFDCGFHDKMTDRENKLCAKQLMLLFGDNRIEDDPFDLHLCNFEKSSPLGSSLRTYIPSLLDPEFPMNVHQKSYLDLFPKEQLVYLTPHCRHEMKEFDHDAIYIIGAIVDKVNQTPLSLARAKEQNIKMMKFPLDRYLSWTSGSGKSLTLNHVVAILADLKKTGDWKYSLRHVPQRKLVRDEDILEEAKGDLLKTRKQWTPTVNLDNLHYNRNVKNWDGKRAKRQVSVSSLFKKN